MALWGGKKGERIADKSGSSQATPVTAPNEGAASLRPSGATVALSSGVQSEDYLTSRYGIARIAIPAGRRIKGSLTYDIAVRVDGTLRGALTSTAAVILSNTGRIEGDVVAEILVIQGEINGDIRAFKEVQILAGGVVNGIVEAPSLIIEAGGVVNGECRTRACELAFQSAA